jgi:hypothetical protein
LIQKVSIVHALKNLRDRIPALVFAWTGELDLAFEMLADLAKTRTVFIAATE